MTITLVTTSFMALLLLALSYRVSKVRLATRTSIGDGGHADLQRANRVQGNFTEYVPLALILIGLLEYSRVSVYLVVGLAALLVVGRVLHAIGLSMNTDSNPFRFLGTLFTWLVLLIGALVGLLAGYGLAPITG
ncbi:MAPEG family protein [Yunchengibacter salinarum]|uniref:MAPEG family protein n=1 Tax=Yunchengibacter salinarum TaxID=3133399 RepID=UPI0035B60E84